MAALAPPAAHFAMCGAARPASSLVRPTTFKTTVLRISGGCLQLPTSNSQPPISTPNSQLPTPNSQLPQRRGSMERGEMWSKRTTGGFHPTGASLAPREVAVGSWELNRSPCSRTLSGADCLQHPLVFAGDRLEHVELQAGGQHVPRVRLDLQMPGRAGPQHVAEHVRHVTLCRPEQIVLAGEERDVEVDAPVPRLRRRLVLEGVGKIEKVSQRSIGALDHLVKIGRVGEGPQPLGEALRLARILRERDVERGAELHAADLDAGAANPRDRRARVLE